MLAASERYAPENQWKEVGKTELISRSTNGPKGKGTGVIKHMVGDGENFFKIKVKGEPGTVYQIAGSWDIN